MNVTHLRFVLIVDIIKKNSKEKNNIIAINVIFLLIEILMDVEIL
jgi:hypothetical protein